MRVIFLAAFAFLAASCGAPPATDFVAHGVSAELVNRIERRIDMPPGAERLGAYDRYYSRAEVGDILRGVFLRRGAFGLRIENAVPLPHSLNAYAVEENRLPVIFDGGCSVVYLEADLSADRLRSSDQAETIACGGF